MMKKQLLPGVALGLSLFVSVAVWANSVRDTQSPVKLPNPEEAHVKTTVETTDLSQPNGPYRDRLTDNQAQDFGARWGQFARSNQPDIMAFTSTFAANNAALLLGNSGNSLSFASFGRVPYYQMLTVTNQITTGQTTSSGPVASLPEPATLTLLGAGLAALAAGLRKRKKKINK